MEARWIEYYVDNVELCKLDTYLSPGDVCLSVSTSVNTTEEPPPALGFTSPCINKQRTMLIKILTKTRATQKA